MKHGHAKNGEGRNPTYISWYNMIRRCKSGRYQQDGIVVCERWEEYRNFFEDMGQRPEDTTLDRLDNKKGYFKENCRWATISEQNYNRIDGKRRSRYSKYRGVYRKNENSSWCATIKINGKQIHLGSFKTEIEAAEAYNKALDEQKIFAPRNKIEDLQSKITELERKLQETTIELGRVSWELSGKDAQLKVCIEALKEIATDLEFHSGYYELACCKGLEYATDALSRIENA